MSTKTIKDSLQSLFKELGYENKINNYHLLEQWSEIVGDKIAAITTAQKIEEQILYVKVKNSSWRTELNMQKRIILNKIEKQFDKDLIIDIRFY